jgi:hypothetical protein
LHKSTLIKLRKDSQKILHKIRTRKTLFGFLRSIENP